jgi:hypothetical protein
MITEAFSRADDFPKIRLRRQSSENDIAPRRKKSITFISDSFFCTSGSGRVTKLYKTLPAKRLDRESAMKWTRMVVRSLQLAPSM